MKEMAAAGRTEVIERDITLTVNGSERRIPAGWTLADLLASLDLDARTIAERAMVIAGEICIYTNANIVLEEL